MPLKPSHIAAAVLLAGALGLAQGVPGGFPGVPGRRALAQGDLPAQEEKGERRTWTNGAGMEFVLLPPGTFVLGGERPAQPLADADEAPPHEVTLERGFWCGVTEVTQAQWERVTGKESPSMFKGADRPVETVSWADAQGFLEALNCMEGAVRYRLLTEAEWAYAAKAGTSSAWSWGPDPAEAGDYAWYRENAGGGTRPVAGLSPNPWGLYDMHGNVWEWVSDWYGAGWYLESPRTDPRGPAEGDERVVRGGAWDTPVNSLRSDNRASQLPLAPDQSVGFRVAFSAGEIRKRLYPGNAPDGGFDPAGQASGPVGRRAR
ncbi:MAG: formylglycine-generating enzyme family protein [Deltaproteobacteria bacterium]|jgi:formylglycine-generating enzyme required for sulfatase activity|nr:formylglycine-generating enzyme family protein [Deltaproteobacteria bacterium]